MSQVIMLKLFQVKSFFFRGLQLIMLLYLYRFLNGIVRVLLFFVFVLYVKLTVVFGDEQLLTVYKVSQMMKALVIDCLRMLVFQVCLSFRFFGFSLERTMAFLVFSVLQMIQRFVLFIVRLMFVQSFYEYGNWSWQSVFGSFFFVFIVSVFSLYLIIVLDSVVWKQRFSAQITASVFFSGRGSTCILEGQFRRNWLRSSYSKIWRMSGSTVSIFYVVFRVEGCAGWGFFIYTSYLFVIVFVVFRVRGFFI